MLGILGNHVHDSEIGLLSLIHSPNSTQNALKTENIRPGTEKKLMEEGCLSVPGQRAKVLRSLEVEVEYNDLNMNKKTIRADGDLAHCLQHEIDHTNGVVYIDYLSKIK